jgi:hypothetical protein
LNPNAPLFFGSSAPAEAKLNIDLPPLGAGFSGAFGTANENPPAAGCLPESEFDPAPSAPVNDDEALVDEVAAAAGLVADAKLNLGAGGVAV